MHIIMKANDRKYLVFLFPSSQNSMSTQLDLGSICGYIIKAYETKLYLQAKKPQKAKLC